MKKIKPLFYLGLLFVLFFAGTTFVTAQNVEYMMSSEYVNAVREEFYRLINAHRRANRLQELEVNTDLEIYADIRAAELRTRFSHTRPDGSEAGSGWYNAQNFMNTRYAENARSTGMLNPDPLRTANEIFTSWRNSSGHNAHMLFNFSSHITMALGIYPELSEDGTRVSSGAIFASGYGVYMTPEELVAIRNRPEEEVRREYPNGNLSDDFFQLIGTTAYRVVRGRDLPPDVVVIPETFNGLPVREISPTSGSTTNSAFGHRGTLAIYFPEGLRSINFGTFWHNTGFTRITIPESVETIATNAFTGCTNLVSVTFFGTITSRNFASDAFPGDLRSKYLAGGPGTYTRVPDSNTWTRE